MSSKRKLSDVPGIIVAQFPPEQTARILGTGIEVWEVLQVHRQAGEDWGELRATFDWLTEEQLGAALEYARLHPGAMEARLQAEAEAEREVEQLWKEYPATAPKSQ